MKMQPENYALNGELLAKINTEIRFGCLTTLQMRNFFMIKN